MRDENRENVYGVIDGELDYQQKRWADFRDGDSMARSQDEFILYLESYARRAADTTTRGDEEQAMEEVRKIAALAVACMERHGAIPRKA